MEIKYLYTEDKKMIRPLYEECFNDSVEFVDYYFEKRIMNNDVLVACEEGVIVSMMQLVPKKIVINDEIHQVHYIYGVATREEYRRRGYMRALMERAIQDLKGKGEPFVYLIPENEDVYREFGFTTVYNKQKYKVRKLVEENKIYEYTEFDINLMKTLFDNNIPPKYNTYIVHDEEYYRQVLEEMKLEHGFLIYHIEGDEIVGYSLVTGDNNVIESIYDAKPMKLALKKTVPWIMLKPLSEDCNTGKVFINDET